MRVRKDVEGVSRRRSKDEVDEVKAGVRWEGEREEG
tara:strand:+ start:306 stop:413 length:108 start_codon:yes stop_codon:yes gene_type:complete